MEDDRVKKIISAEKQLIIDIYTKKIVHLIRDDCLDDLLDIKNKLIKEL